MSQPSISRTKWLFQDTVKEDYQGQELWEEKQKLAEERRKLEQDKSEFYYKQKIEEKRLSQESHLFEMKWKILENELQNLAKEKQEIEQQKEQYYNTYREKSYVGENGQKIVKGELLFSGVRNELALKKRYKDLIKIFHPDNMSGDTNTIQEINKEYDNLRKVFGI